MLISFYRVSSLQISKNQINKYKSYIKNCIGSLKVNWSIKFLYKKGGKLILSYLKRRVSVRYKDALNFFKNERDLFFHIFNFFSSVSSFINFNFQVFFSPFSTASLIVKNKTRLGCSQTRADSNC